ncbi:MAG: hypothetical protein M1828_001057 [Chrysothrix sp. TS-e1954]|nr:MAG: hypothetical protein M1828_001057 [Chrysothrix sp. TS-e1954]
MSSQKPLPRAIVFDLGDVTFAWSATTSTGISANKLREILDLPVWHDYERGRITRDACYEEAGSRLSLQASDISEAFAQARKSLEPNHGLVSLIQDLKRNGAIKVFAMSNVGREDFDQLSSSLDWTLFDRVFTSAAAGTRKPESSFYKHVLSEVKLTGEQLMFVDDRSENVLAAQDHGIHGLVFDDSTIHTLQTMFDGPVGRGWRYIFRQEKQYDSITSTGIVFGDNFANLLILDLFNDPLVVQCQQKSS